MAKYETRFSRWLSRLEDESPSSIVKRTFVGFVKVYTKDLKRKGREYALFEVENYIDGKTCVFFLAPRYDKVAIFYNRKPLDTVPMDIEGAKKAWEIFKEYCR